LKVNLGDVTTSVFANHQQKNPFKRHTRETGGSISKPREAKRPVASVGCNLRHTELPHQNAKARHRQNQIMNLLDPKTEGNISPLIHGITKEHRDFILDISKSASNWHEFEAKLNAGGLPVAIKGEIQIPPFIKDIPRKHSLPSTPPSIVQ
jgi:hypothetical protein